jgi:isopenicillin N synthase-like dioxygenase
MPNERVPVIDISRLCDATTLAALDAACQQWGFFQVVDHGVDQSVINQLIDQTRRFFALPVETKRSLVRTAENSWGFNDGELTKNTRDWKEIFDCGPPDGANRLPQWPPAMPDFRLAASSYYASCEQLAFRLLDAIGSNLGLAAGDLSEGFVPKHTSFLRLNYYPRCPDPENPDGLNLPKTGHLAINHHTDAGAITVLAQDSQPGLEVYRNGTWHLIDPREDSLVINIGDIVQVWSNDRYTAPVHRVVANTANERFSAPFFFSPSYAANYAPLATMTSERSPPRYRTINWGEFYAKRAAGDYADLGEEVQISQYRA